MNSIPLSPTRDYFLPYQIAWIEDESPMKLCEKSRRVGFTYASSYRMVRKCMTRKNFTQWVSSRDLGTARELITDYVAKWCKALQIVATGLDGQWLPLDSDKDVQVFVAYFPATNCRIVSLSSTPAAFAGKGGDVFLDELDLHKASGILLDMATPCTTWGGQLEAVSAYDPDGSPTSTFATTCRDAKDTNPMGWSFHRVTVLDAIAQGFVEKVNEMTGGHLTREAFLAALRAKTRTEAAWKSQYLCEPQDDGGALLPYGLITAVEADCLRALDTLPASAVLYGGLDIGRKHDLSVFWIDEVLGDVAYARVIYALDRAPFHVQMDALNRFMADPRLKRMCIDATGIGAMLAEEAVRKHGSARAEAIVFTAQSKDTMATRLLQQCQDAKCRVPADPEVRNDLHKIRKVVGISGAIRYQAESDEAGHADRFWAKALAAQAASLGGNDTVGAMSLGELGGRQVGRAWDAPASGPVLAATAAEHRELADAGMARSAGGNW